jgi:hypothetical protein
MAGVARFTQTYIQICRYTNLYIYLKVKTCRGGGKTGIELRRVLPQSGTGSSGDPAGNIK